MRYGRTCAFQRHDSVNNGRVVHRPQKRGQRSSAKEAATRYLALNKQAVRACHRAPRLAPSPRSRLSILARPQPPLPSRTPPLHEAVAYDQTHWRSQSCDVPAHPSMITPGLLDSNAVKHAVPVTVLRECGMPSCFTSAASDSAAGNGCAGKGTLPVMWH